MRYLLPLIASSALVAAAPRIKTVCETVVVTATQYVEEAAPTGTTGDSPAIPYFASTVVPSVVSSAVSSVAPYSAPNPVVPSPAAPSAAAPSKPADAALPALPTDVSKPANKDGQGQATTASTQSTSKSDSVLARMPESDILKIVKTCWNGAIPWPIPNTPAPCVDVVAPQLGIYPRPASKANTLTINNYCGYDIYYSHLAGSPNVVGRGVIKAQTSLDQPLTGTLVRASKTPARDGKDDYATPALVEYGANNGQIFYDLSLINCIVNGDTKGCAGHEAGLQIGGPKAMTFQCAAGAWCDDQVYMYQENLCKKQNPVSATSVSNGLTVDFCASQKK